MTELPPWLHEPWNQLQNLIKTRRFPHALLFSGAEGMGKALLADRLVRTLLCQNSAETAEPCGHCSACKLYAVGNHPDARLVEPELEIRQFAPVIKAIALNDPGSKGPRKTRLISIGQIREVRDFVWTHSQLGQRKVIVIAPAETMNVNAANSLLKALEEPGSDANLVLLSERPSGLPATIRSRCQVVNIHRPAKGVAEAWLKGQGVEYPGPLLTMAQGAPILALKMMELGILDTQTQALSDFEQMQQGRRDVLALAADWFKSGAMQYLDFMHSWISDMIRLQTLSDSAAGMNSELASRLQRLSEGLAAQELYRRLDLIQSSRRLLERTVSEQAVLEDALLPWAYRRNKRR